MLTALQSIIHVIQEVHVEGPYLLIFAAYNYQKFCTLFVENVCIKFDTGRGFRYFLENQHYSIKPIKDETVSFE